MNTRVTMSANGRFIHVDPIPQHAHTVRCIPTARWGKTVNAWVIRVSRAAWSTLATLAGAQFDDASMVEIEKANAGPPPERPWPVWFRFKTEPFPHQTVGAAKVYGRRESYLDADPGMGKTKMLIDAYAAKFASGDIQRVIIFCPKTVRHVWAEELAKHCPIPYQVEFLKNNRKKSDLVFDGKTMPVLLVSTEGMSTDATLKECIKYTYSHKIGTIIDEAHMIKTPSALRTKNVTAIASFSASVSLASGTMLGNGIEDLYSQFFAMNPEIIGYPDFFSFRERYCVMGGYRGKRITGYKNLDELRSMISPYIATARMGDLILPKIYTSRKIEMGRVQRAKYDELSRFLKLKDDGIETTNTLDLMSRLHQIAGGFLPIIKKTNIMDSNGQQVERSTTVGYDQIDDGKIRELIEIVDHYPDRSIIVWCCYRHEIEAVIKALSDKYGADTVSQMHGGMDEAERAISRQTLQSGGTRFLVGTQTAGGVGTTMTAATVTVYYSNTFSYINRKQSEDRSYRIGQTKQVTIIDMIAEDSIDELVLKALSDKTDLAKWLTVNPEFLNIFGTYRA